MRRQQHRSHGLAGIESIVYKLSISECPLLPQTMASMLRRELVRLNSVDQIAVREILGITFPQMVRFVQLAEVTEN